jgi:hypothetical protein
VQITRSQTLSRAISSSWDATGIFDDLLKDTDVGQRHVRLLGVSFSSLHSLTQPLAYQQMDLFDVLGSN